jgi:hypothetical protein
MTSIVKPGRLGVRAIAVLVISIPMLLAASSSGARASAPEFRGVMLHSLWESDEDMERELDLAAEAGSNVVRVNVGWSALEQAGNGEYNLPFVEKLDRFVGGAAARGMRVVAMLWNTPCWASSAPPSVKQGCEGAWWDRGVQWYPPENPNEYAEAARWMTDRYGTSLAALEVWNEPNLIDGYWWRTTDPAGDYAELLKAAYPAAKAGNPSVPVLAGALQGGDRQFLEELYAHGVQGSYDGLSIHPYNEWRAPDDHWVPEWSRYTFLPAIESVRAAQIEAGDGAPLWLTEFGWTTAEGAYAYRDQRFTVSEAQQAAYIARALELVCSMEFVEAALVYNLRDNGTDPAAYEENFGLVRRDFSPKPALEAFQAAEPHCEGSPEVNLSKVKLSARKKARRGVPLKLRGSVAAPGHPPAGAGVDIEFKKGGGWRSFARTRVKVSGAFKARARLRGAGRSRYVRLRAVVEQFGSSKAIRVRILP